MTRVFRGQVGAVRAEERRVVKQGRDVAAAVSAEIRQKSDVLEQRLAAVEAARPGPR